MFKTPAPHRAPKRPPGALAVLAVAFAAFTAPAGATAAVRTGSVQDPQGDASGLSGPVLDIASAGVRYDDAAGTLRVTWTYYDDVRAIAAPGEVGGGLWVQGPAASSTPAAWIGWTLSSDGAGGSVTSRLSLSYTAGTLEGTGTISDDGRVVTTELTHAQLVGRDWQMGDGSVWAGDTVSRFLFDGFSDRGPGGPIGPPTVPGEGDSGDVGMTINGGDLYTNDPHVKLSIVAPAWASWLRVDNDGGFQSAESFVVTKTIRWKLAESGRERLPKTVYLRFGNDTQTFTDDIILDQTDPVLESATLVAPAAAAATWSAAPARTATSASRTYRVRVRARDANSGLAKVQFAARSKRRPSAPRAFRRVSRYRGKHVPSYVRVRDRAGNYSRWRSIR